MKKCNLFHTRYYLIAGLIMSFLPILFTVVTGEKEPQWQYDLTDEFNTIAISDDGEFTVVGSKDGNISFFDNANQAPQWSYPAGASVNTISISANGSAIVAGTDDNLVLHFTDSQPVPLWTYSADGPITRVDLTSDGDFFTVASEDKNIYFFGSENSVPIWNYTADTIIDNVRIASNGTQIVASSIDLKFYTFDVIDSQPLWNFSAEGIINSISISSDGDYIIIGSNDNHAYFFNIEDQSPLWNYSADNSILSVSISSDGNHLVIGSADQRLHYFSNASNVPIWNYTTTSTIRSVEISENGEYITCGTDDGTTHFFSIDSNTPIWSYILNGDVTSLELSHDGFSLAVGTSNNRVYLFSRVSAYIKSISPNPSLRGEDVTFKCSGFSDDGGITDYLWESDIDGEFYESPSNSIDVSLSVGMHRITVRAKDEHGTWSSPLQSSLIVSDEPKAYVDDIQVKHINDEYGLVFTGHGTVKIGEIDQYQWFSTVDGLLYLGPESTFYYNGLTSGDQTIRLSVRSNYGFWSDEDVVGYVVNDRPIAVIEVIDPDPGIFGENMLFSGEVQDDDEIVHFVWTSNIDGEIYNGTGGTFLTNDLSAGGHIISFKVQDDEGFWSLVENKSLIVHHRPVAHIESTTTKILYYTQEIGFTGSGDDDGTITEYLWDSLTDDVLYRGAESQFSTSSLSVGIHNISLKVKDNYGVWSFSANINISVLRIPNIRSAYLGDNRVVLSWLSEIEIAPTFWVNGIMQRGNESFSQEKDEIVQFEDGTNSYYIQMETRNGFNLQTPTLFLDIEKEGVFSDPYVDVTVRGNRYKAIEIGEMREIGDLSDYFPKHTLLEFQIRADKPLDVLILESDDYEDWKTAFDEGSGNIHYYEDFSFFNISNVTFSFETINEEALYLILDNTKLPKGGTHSSKDIHVEFSLFVVHKPIKGYHSDYLKKSEQIDGEGISSSGGSSTSILVLIVIIVGVLVSGGIIAYNKGLFPQGQDSEEDGDESEIDDDEYSEEDDGEYQEEGEEDSEDDEEKYDSEDDEYDDEDDEYDDEEDEYSDDEE